MKYFVIPVITYGQEQTGENDYAVTLTTLKDQMHFKSLKENQMIF